MLDQKEMGNQEEMSSGFSDWKKRNLLLDNVWTTEFNPPKSGLKRFSGDNLMDI